jgi:hypothetical protein
LDDFRASTSSVAGRLAAAFERATDLLEQSAEMAVVHAEREATKGRDDRAAIERERARQAQERRETRSRQRPALEMRHTNGTTGSGGCG